MHIIFGRPGQLFLFLGLAANWLCYPCLQVTFPFSFSFLWFGPWLSRLCSSRWPPSCFLFLGLQPSLAFFSCFLHKAFNLEITHASRALDCKYLLTFSRNLTFLPLLGLAATNGKAFSGVCLENSLTPRPRCSGVKGAFTVGFAGKVPLSPSVLICWAPVQLLCELPRVSACFHR